MAQGLSAGVTREDVLFHWQAIARFRLRKAWEYYRGRLGLYKGVVGFVSPGCIRLYPLMVIAAVRAYYGICCRRRITCDSAK